MRAEIRKFVSNLKIKWILLQKITHTMTLGIDIGGTTICLGVIENGKVLRKETVPSFALGMTMEQTLDYLSSHIAPIVGKENVEKIGIGVPCVVDTVKGIVYDAVNIPSWNEVALKDYLEGKFHCPVAINNDANCFAMGAYGMFPEDSKPEVLVGVTLGTGVGIGIIDRGRLFNGANCGAGELGSMPFKEGILEEICSRMFFVEAGIGCKEAAEAAGRNDPEALALFEKFGRNLGELLCIVMYAYDPSHIVLGGGIAYSYPYFRAAMETYIRENFPYTKIAEKLCIEVFTGNDIPLIGASLI